MDEKALLDRVAALEAQQERLQAVEEVRNLMGRYCYYHVAGMMAEHVSLFANRDDTLAQVGDWGLYKGIEGIKRLYGGAMAQPLPPGHMFEHDLTTSVIEVAADGKTAKAVWMSPGHETFGDFEGGDVRATWCWTKYACDFIKEDGEWKIWHLFNFLTFYADFYRSWTQDGGEHPMAGFGSRLPADMAPDGPSILRHLPYRRDTFREFLPAFPRPYESYDEQEGVNWIDPQPERKAPYVKV